MIKLVVFDWNGTLLADTEANIVACNAYINEFGGREVTRAECARLFSFPTVDFYTGRGCDAEAIKRPEAAQFFHTPYETLAAKCRTRKGARQILKWIKNQQATPIILSNHLTASIAGQLERLALTMHIPEVLGNGDLHSTQIGNNKIHRMGAYFERTGITPRESLIVGDAPEDIEIGRKFGMYTAGITDGLYATSRLRAANPHYLIGSLLEIKDIVEKLNNDPCQPKNL